jgi:membrane protein
MIRSRDFADLARRSAQGWVADAAPSMGAALAFYALLSLAPLLLVALGLAGFLFGREAAHDALVAQVASLLGDQSAMGVETLLDAAGTREEGLMPALVGGVLMFVGATTLFGELRMDLDRIWRYAPSGAGGIKRQLATRAAAFLMVMVIGLLLVGSMLASAFFSTVGAERLGLSEAALHALEFATSFVVVTLLFASIYKILPSKRIAWGDVWAGAAVTSLLFWVGKLAIALYLAKAAVDSSFGAAGALVVLILWVYYSAQVFFLGAEFTKEYALYHGSARNERKGRRLTDMNASYEALLERAKRITQRRDPIFGK